MHSNNVRQLQVDVLGWRLRFCPLAVWHLLHTALLQASAFSKQRQDLAAAQLENSAAQSHMSMPEPAQSLDAAVSSPELPFVAQPRVQASEVGSVCLPATDSL